MSNTLTNLITPMYTALDVVARELVGFIPSVTRNSSAERAAVGESIIFPVVGAMSTSNITASATGPDPSANTIGNKNLTISKAKSVTFFWEGEEQRGLNNSGLMGTVLQNQFEQAMRDLCNEIESDLASLYVSSSRAYGTAGTTPFASTLSDPAQMRKILDDNGCPPNMRNMVIDTTAGAALRSLAQLNKANEAGTTTLREQGTMLDIHGFKIRESAQVKSHTKGTGASYVTNLTSSLAVGDTDIAIDTGSGTVLAGDVATFAGDTNKYVVSTALSGGSMSIADPGLRATLADGVALTVGNSYTANMAFHESAIQLVTRAPAMPEGGDAADDVMEIQDPRSGLAFQVALYRQRRRVAYEVGIAWGYKAVKPEFMAILLG